MISQFEHANGEWQEDGIFVWWKQQLKCVNVWFIRVGEDQITPVMSVQNLGVIFYPNLKIGMQITKACQNHPGYTCRLLRAYSRVSRLVSSSTFGS